jgi:two-component system sensor histidine kinase BaeS
MFSSLRGRLILSHILPLLVILPLTGLALVYTLETRIILDSLSSEVQSQAVLVAEIAADRAEIWHDPSQAQAFATFMNAQLDARVMLLDPGGHLLSSSDPDDARDVGQRLELVGWATVLSGKPSASTLYSQHLHKEVVDVLVPVVGPDQQMLGVLRMSHRLGSVYERFLRLRYLILGVLAGGLFLGAALGWLLALNLELPLKRVTQAVHGLIGGETLGSLPEQGPAEIRLLLRSVNSLVMRLRNLEQARRQLLANLVHELGRPLGALRSALEALLRGADEDASLRRELLTGMEEEVDRLRRLLNDLAGFYDQVLGTLELDLRPTDLGAWLARMLSPWREAAQAKGLRWQVEVSTALPTVTIDPDRLGQALGNLLSNAVKYTPTGGTISVRAGVQAPAAWIQVADTGPGIAPEELDRIFTPLYRGQAGRRFPQGMGLGLSIARDLAIAHGGRLEAESTPGAGSAFTLWLPLNPSS